MQNNKKKKNLTSAQPGGFAVQRLVIPRPATTKPVCIDFFCCAGGMAKGYANAGFYVIGIDKDPQLNFPFEFYQADFFDIEIPLWADLISASPPCQRFTQMLFNRDGTYRSFYPDLIANVRNRFQDWAHKTGRPYIVENVRQAPLRNPVMLCGSMFGLQVQRHRYFESNYFILNGLHCQHSGKVARKRGDGGTIWQPVGHNLGTREEWGTAMKIDWMKSKYELSQAIPPAYSEYLAKQILPQLAQR